MALSVYRLVYELNGRGIVVPFLARVRDNSLVKIAQTSFGAHPSSFSIVTGVSFRCSKTAGELRYLPWSSAEVNNERNCTSTAE